MSRARSGKHGFDVVCMGEALWDLVTPPGQTFARAASLALSPGGGAVNMALALAGAGHRVALAAAVGVDALGDALVARVAAAGVDTSLVARSPARTGVAFVQTSPLRVVTHRAADEVPPSLPRVWRARVLAISGLLPSAAQASSFEAAARAARRRGARVVVDLNARPRFWRGVRDVEPFLRWLRLAHLIKASTDDLELLASTIAQPSWPTTLATTLVVTDGAGPVRARGELVERGELGELVVPTRRLADPQCALGAGDAFTAGMIDALLGSPDHEEGAVAWREVLLRGHALARRRLRRRPQRTK
jgi:sugar/nucleoside kinase (ribokinase family)